MYQAKNNKKGRSTKKYKGTKIPKMTEADLDRIYKGLNKMEGMAGQPSVTDASSTIDEVLYGENGAWRGSER